MEHGSYFPSNQRFYHYKRNHCAVKNWFHEIFWAWSRSLEYFSTVWKLRNFTTHSVEIWEFFPRNFLQIFRQTNFPLKIYTVYRFDEKIFKWGKFSEISTLCCHGFSQIFRQINVLLKNFTLNWFDEKKFAWQWISRFSTLCFPHCALEINFVIMHELMTTLISRIFCKTKK